VLAVDDVLALVTAQPAAAEVFTVDIKAEDAEVERDSWVAPGVPLFRRDDRALFSEIAVERAVASGATATRILLPLGACQPTGASSFRRTQVTHFRVNFRIFGPFIDRKC